MCIVNKKAAKRWEGLSREASNMTQYDVLIHCASLGEYEQVYPIINWIIEHTNLSVLVSFFSPSGYEYAEIPPVARVAKRYMPFDTKTDITKWLAAIKPSFIIINKNEFWWNLLATAKKDHIPTYMTSVSLRADKYFVKYPLDFFLSRLQAVDRIYLVDKNSLKIAETINLTNIVVVGDTRTDRVKSLKNTKRANCQIDRIIYGSVWASDMKVVRQIILSLPSYEHHLYPHDLTDRSVATIESQLQDRGLAGLSIELFRSMGQLKHAYAHASLAYVGGGYGDGVHNVLEAVVHGIPVIVGPNHSRSPEVQELIDLGIVFETDGTSAGQIATAVLDKDQKSFETVIDSYFDRSSSTGSICNDIFASHYRQNLEA